MRGIRSILLTLIVALATSCAEKITPHEGTYSDVLIYMGLGYNDLSRQLEDDLEDIFEGMLPDYSEGKAVVAFCHNTAASGDYRTTNPPSLIWLYRKDGKTTADTLHFSVRDTTRNTVFRDTLKTYPDAMISADAATIRQVMDDIIERFPSRHYGMVFSSHATGWIPEGYNTSSEYAPLSIAPSSIGAQFYRDKSGHTKTIEIGLSEFASAIPVKMDYIIFDACLMGGIEVAWELRNVCDRLVFSPAEILSDGMVYSTIGKRLLSGSTPDLKGVCKDYFDYYNVMSGPSRSATITLVDCRRLDDLASAFKEIVSNHRDRLARLYPSAVQGYFYDSKAWFYDLEDLCRHIVDSPDELNDLHKALDLCVEYHAETPSFFYTKLLNCCGLSVYLPHSDWHILNNLYKTLAWNEATGLVE